MLKQKEFILVRHGSSMLRVYVEPIGDNLGEISRVCAECQRSASYSLIDIVQLGFWVDKGLHIRACSLCGHIWAYRYHYEVGEALEGGKQ